MEYYLCQLIFSSLTPLVTAFSSLSLLSLPVVPLVMVCLEMPCPGHRRAQHQQYHVQPGLLPPDGQVVAVTRIWDDTGKVKPSGPTDECLMGMYNLLVQGDAPYRLSLNETTAPFVWGPQFTCNGDFKALKYSYSEL